MPFPSAREMPFAGDNSNNNNNMLGGNSSNNNNLGILGHSVPGGSSNRHPSIADNNIPGGALFDSFDGGGDNEGMGHFGRSAGQAPVNPMLGSNSSSSNMQLQNPIGSSAKFSSNSGGAPRGGSPGSTTTTTTGTTGSQQEDEAKIYRWIMELMHGSSREQALLELGKKREQFEDLALILWNAYGVMATLVQEIIAVYPALNPPTLSAAASNRVCNALALLQCVASRNDTRGPFLNANIPLFLYPFLNTTSKTRPFEYLRLTSLGVIGALVKNDSSEVISFLLSTEIIPLCLRIMETGSELSKTVAIFIVQKILLDDVGLAYVCQTYERFYAVASVLSNMVDQLVDQQAVRLLKHVVRCYLRLSDNARARQALRQCLPEPLRDATFSHALRDDAATKRCLAQLLVNLSDSYE